MSLNINKDEIKSRLTALEKQKDIEINVMYNSFAKFYDKADDRHEIIHYPEMLTSEDYFRLINKGSTNLDMVKLVSILEKYVDRHMFMNIADIYFLDNHEDYLKAKVSYIDLSYPYHQYLGWRESLYSGTIVIVNVDVIRKEVLKGKHYQEFDMEDRVNLLVLETLIHELKHALNNNILIDTKEVPIEEDFEWFVIEYAKSIVQKIIDNKEDFRILK